MDTARRIKHVREIRGETRAELANLLGIHPTTVACWEGKKRTPGPNMMAAVLRAFGLTAGQFYSLKLPPEPPKGGRKGAR